eukprot:gene14167-15646_t
MLNKNILFCLVVVVSLLLYILCVNLSTVSWKHPFRLPKIKRRNFCSLHSSIEPKECKQTLIINKDGGERPLGSVLLAINFNHPFYENVPVILKFYRPIFQKYVLCGPEFDKTGRFDIIKIPQPKKEYGFYGYQCLVEAIRRNNKGYSGYFYVNDDMIVNWWNFLQLDKTKIWFGNKKFQFENGGHAHGHVMGAKPSPWSRTKADCGNRCSQTFASMEQSTRFNNTGIFQTYFKNSGNKRICIGGLSDVFYIPARLAAKYQLVAQAFYENLVFLEVAVPMSLVLLDDISNMVFFEGLYLQVKYGWSDWTLNTDIAWKEYNYDVYFLHPYKLTGENRTKNSGEFQERVAAKSETIICTNCLDIVKLKNK